ncbi:MAG: hypothetical protein GOV01_00060 [Candidatus Altiarchaeota archaeon]|nr:hypothetical protein [Candidatus Altiarchaeota archaeon]
MAVRYWAFRDMKFEHEGFYPPDMYKALWNFFSDRGYGISEWRYAHGWYGDGSKQAAVGVWIGSTEIEGKYVISALDIHWKLTWSLAPKPGDKGETPQMVPKGSFSFFMNGAIVVDYLNVWASSPLLRPFFPIRDAYFYRRRREVHLTRVRQDAEQIVKDIKEYLSFLPTVK